MTELTYSFLADGPTDKRLMSVIDWVLVEQLPDLAIQSEWCDLSRLPTKPRGLRERMCRSVELYPCDVLFVHRDTERDSIEARISEINSAAEGLGVPVVCVVPKRMQEAWMLFDEDAIRMAACNPNGRDPLEMPPLRRCEDIPDPKAVLHEALRRASGLPPRRQKLFSPEKSAYRITEQITDFSPLRNLPSFQVLEQNAKAYIDTHMTDESLRRVS